MTGGSIVIPAHNEEAVITRTLASLAPLLTRGIEIVVAPNGCHDGTAERARAMPGVQVIEVAEASKTAALNAADAVTTGWPRLYLDADISITADAVEQVFAELAKPGVLAARPAFHYDTLGADVLTRAYYRARNRIPTMHQHLWGAGAYALTEEAHSRLGVFPGLIADDLFVDQLFDRTEISIVPTTPVPVRVPRTAAALVRTLARVQSGKRQVTQIQHVEPAGGLRPLLRGVGSPSSLADAAVYTGFAVVSRIIARRRPDTWHRDLTNRVADPEVSEAVDHVVLTRFNVPSVGVESLIRAKEGWLRGRVELFESFTAPSMKRQRSAYTWLVYFDPESPAWFKDWIQPLADAGLFVPIFRESVSHDDLVGDLRQHVERRADVLITTNLDNDDGVAADFLTRIQQVPTSTHPSAVYLASGLIRRADEVFLREDRHNAFCSVRERWDAPQTCWADWHNRLARHMPVMSVEGDPAWMQVVHDTNVSNRVNGKRVSPQRYRERFTPLLDGIESPDRRSLIWDRLVGRPARFARESTRSAMKHAVLSLVGTGGLDRLKAVVRRRTDRTFAAAGPTPDRVSL